MIRHELTHWWTLARNVGASARDLARGLLEAARLRPYVTVFASSRFSDADPEYRQALHLGRRLAEDGHAVMTGGGTGLMAAVNRGVREAGGRSWGCRVRDRREKEPNDYLDRCIELDNLFVRKALLLEAEAFVALPGGFGTLDEVFEALALIQAAKVRPRKVIFLGASFWQPLLAFVRGPVRSRGTIDERDLASLLLTDDLDVVMAELSRGA